MALLIRGLAPLLQVYDMPRAARFYRDLLGFTLAQHSPPLDDEPLNFHWCLLERDGVELMLNTAYDEGERPDEPDSGRFDAHQDTALFFDCPDPEAAWEHLTANRYPAERPKVAPYGMKQLFLRDPDGYEICFQWPADQCP